MDRLHEDRKIEGIQEASAALAIGVLFLVICGVTALFWFASMRSGTPFWRDYTIALGIVGVALTGLGLRGRSVNS